MSFKIDFSERKVTSTFNNIVKENEIKNAFLQIVETIDIKKIDYLVLDFTGIISYTIPKDYMNILKTVTHFSTTWNSEIDIIVIATNPEIRAVVNGIIKHSAEFKWGYHLFDDLETVNKIFNLN